jgi:hypothetical protein
MDQRIWIRAKISWIRNTVKVDQLRDLTATAIKQKKLPNRFLIRAFNKLQAR